VKNGKGQYFDYEKKKQFAEYYSNGRLREQK
jgi:SAM domain (Sterile alpha motif)